MLAGSGGKQGGLPHKHLHSSRILPQRLRPLVWKIDNRIDGSDFGSWACDETARVASDLVVSNSRNVARALGDINTHMLPQKLPKNSLPQKLRHWAWKADHRMDRNSFGNRNGSGTEDVVVVLILSSCSPPRSCGERSLMDRSAMQGWGTHRVESRR